MSTNIDFTTGKSFPQPAINGGYVFMLFSPVFLMDSPLIGIALFLVGMLLSFTVSGIKIDPNKKRFKEYTRYYWIKMGTWNSLNDYPFITVITDHESSVAFSWKKDDESMDEAVYGIYLLNRDRSHKILITKYRDKDEAILKLPELADAIGLKVIS
jgi:hypothetical protein